MGTRPETHDRRQSATAQPSEGPARSNRPRMTKTRSNRQPRRFPARDNPLRMSSPVEQRQKDRALSCSALTTCWLCKPSPLNSQVLSTQSRSANQQSTQQTILYAVPASCTHWTTLRVSTSHNLTRPSAAEVAICAPCFLSNEAAKTPLVPWAPPSPSTNAPRSSPVLPSYSNTWPSDPDETNSAPVGEYCPVPGG